MKFAKHLNPARAKLRDAIDARVAANADQAKAQAEIDRLSRFSTAAADARAALDRFDAEHNAAFAAWAESFDGDVAGAPRPDAEKRNALVSAVEDAEIAARAAEHAKARPAAAASAAGERGSVASRGVFLATKLALIDEAEKMFTEMRAAIAAAHDCKYRVDAARSVILSGLDSSDPSTREVLMALETFDRERTSAEGRPMPLDFNPHFADWKRFEAWLAVDSTASIDDESPISISPPPAFANVLDPVLATASAVDSFDSQSVQR
jgi:hypothetical protein